MPLPPDGALGKVFRVLILKPQLSFCPLARVECIYFPGYVTTLCS